MLSDDAYLNIQGWMISRLGLKGVSLLIYAIIYGFSQDGESVFSGSRKYLMDWCGCSLSAVQKSLKQLKEDGLIEQTEHSLDNHEVSYRAIPYPRVKITRGLEYNLPEARVKSTRGSVTNLPEARVKSTLAYNDNNLADKLEDNLADNIVVCEDKPKRFVKPSLEEVKQYAERNGKSVVDPVRFFDYYTANGWKVGKNPMKDWKAAFRMWEGKEKAEKPASTKKNPSDVPYMQNQYSKDHMKQKESDSLRALDALLEEEEEAPIVWDGKSVLQPKEVQRLSPEDRQKYDKWSFLNEG